jgi:uncharacterized membrane protein YciS (DUF1049 family)
MHLIFILGIIILLLIFIWFILKDHSLRLSNLEERMKKIEKEAVKIVFKDEE